MLRYKDDIAVITQDQGRAEVIFIISLLLHKTEAETRSNLITIISSK